MALPAAMYSNSLSGDVECVEMADAGLGSATMSARASWLATAEGGRCPVNVTRLLDAQSFGERAQPREIRFLLVAANDEAAHLGHARDRLEQHVDALPGVEMARVRDSAEAGRGAEGARVPGGAGVRGCAVDG